jgi:copper homeostasis protein
MVLEMIRKGYLLEVCANSVQSAINAQRAGASRIELCENLPVGGTTPSYGSIKLSRRHLAIAINVLIRPRPGDFLYSDTEFETIKEDIRVSKELGVNGVVCGVLLPDGNVDVDRTRELVELSRPLSFTFHRAFDFTPDPFRALNDVIATGADRILTSGQKSKAGEGIPLLKELVALAGNRIIVMPGSGVNINSIAGIAQTGAKEFHMSGLTVEPSHMRYWKEGLHLNGELPNDNELQVSSVEAIGQVIQYLDRVIL